MQVRASGGKLFLVGSFLAFTLPLGAHKAEAAPHRTRAMSGATSAQAYGVAARLTARDRALYARVRTASVGGLSCVPFARRESGIELVGNAYTWWNKAAGLYARGNQPEVGSVLNFRANPQMRLGHVAVVTNVMDSRHVEIDHANWASRGAITRSVTVVDISPRNDWTAVRVQLPRSTEFGAIYPTYGFIYARADRGTLMASLPDAAPAPVLNAAVRDLRPAAERTRTLRSGTPVEVAELPERRHRVIDLNAYHAFSINDARGISFSPLTTSGR